LVLVTQHIEEITPIFENVLALSQGKIAEEQISPMIGCEGG
jgi:ABC-type molybdenum transport system ATPase subunit/photorepair protein PhrA